MLKLVCPPYGLLVQAFIHPSAGAFNNNRLAWIGFKVHSGSHCVRRLDFPLLTSVGLVPMCAILLLERGVLRSREVYSGTASAIGAVQVIACWALRQVS